MGTPTATGTQAPRPPAGRPASQVVLRGGPLPAGRPRSHRRVSAWRFAKPAIALVLIATATLTAAVAKPPDPAYPSGSLPIGTGDRGTVYYSYGYALMEAIRGSLPELRPYLTATPSSRRNVELVNSGEVAVAFASADTIAGLRSDQTGSLRTLARLYEDYLHLVVRADSNISTLADLRGKRVSIGLEDSGTPATVRDLLNAAGMGMTDLAVTRLGLDASIDALRQHQIDAFFFFGGVPTTRLSELRPFRLVDLEKWVTRLNGYGDTYSRLSIASSMYGTDPITTVGVPTYLIVSRRLDRDLAYALTALLYEQRDTMAKVHRVAKRLDRRAAINTLPLPLHPGAVAYYRDTQI